MPNDCQRQAITLDEKGKVLFELAVSLETWHGGSRFPAFWGPNFDWIPDQDHASVALIAPQTMLLQSEDRKILLLPAWPKNWWVDLNLTRLRRGLLAAERRQHIAHGVSRGLVPSYRPLSREAAAAIDVLLSPLRGSTSFASS